MENEIIFISNCFQKSGNWELKNWELEHEIVKTIFTNGQDLNEIVSIIAKHLTDTCVFVIYIHSTIINKQYADNYGFDIAREVRVKLKGKAPIILYSPVQRAFFEEKSKSEVKYKIIFARGTTFLAFDKVKDELAIAIKELKKTPITDAVLADMNEMLLDQKGVVIDKLTHDLKFAKVGNNINKLKVVLNEAAAYLTNTQLSTLKWSNFCQHLLDSISDAEKFNTASDELIKKCERELISNTKPVKADADKKHIVLVLEDDPDFQKRIEENLKDNFEQLIITGNAEDAIKIINGDGANEIIGIIADWRLYKDQTEYWQLQGYEVLDYAAKNHFTALFALTSLNDHNVHNIRNVLGLDIHLFKKQHLEIRGSNVQWKMMVDVIKQKCDLIIELIGSNQSMGDGWTKSEEKNKNGEITVAFKSLRQQYIEKRFNQWEIFEKSITEHSDRMWEYYKKALTPTNERSLEEISKKWGIKFEKSGIPILENILIVRRIWLALWYNNTRLDFNINRKELPEEKVYCILRQQYYDDLVRESHSLSTTPKTKKKALGTETEKSVEEDVESKMIQNSKNLLNKLCITPSALPNGMLPEEKNWLHRHGILVNQGNDVLDYQSRKEDWGDADDDYKLASDEDVTAIKNVSIEYFDGILEAEDS